MPSKAGRDRTARRGAGEETLADVSALEGWRPARHVADPVTAKLPTRRVTINLDEDVVAIFKAEALRGGPPYQVAINQALRAYLHDRETSAQDRAVQVVLAALDAEPVRRKLRSIR
jgi:uncharacterized protein (DUF4415 family)